MTEVMEQITIDQWMRWKEEIREKLREAAGNFVYIGHRLRQIRDSGMYGGAADVFEFAAREYGLSKSVVSRFMAINEKFSEGGNSTELKAEYRAIGSSKLAEMLTLTDEECRLITERTTVAQVRELKSFAREGSEAALDAAVGGADYTPLQECIMEYFCGKRGMLEDAMGCMERMDVKGASEAVNPSGNASCRKGLVFLFLYEYKDGVKYKTFGQSEITEMSWEDFMEEVCGLFAGGYDAIFGKAEQEAGKAEQEAGKAEQSDEKAEREAREPVATSQQEDEEEGDDGEVEEVAEEDEDAEELEELEDGEHGAGGDEGDEGDPGIDGPVAAAEDDEEEEEDDDEEDGSCIEGKKTLCKQEIRNRMMEMRERYSSENWEAVIEQAEKIIRCAEKMMEWEDET